MTGILTPDGKPFSIQGMIDEVDPIVGYQAEHQVTGRLLPMCNRFEYYKRVEDLYLKMNEVAQAMDEMIDEGFDIFDYHAVEVRQSDLPEGGYVVINYLNV